jgi:hypothetical protein
MGFRLDDIGIGGKLSKDVFDDNIKKCLTSCKLFNDRKLVEPLFELKVKKVNSTRGFMGFVNSLLKNWGLCITTSKINPWNKKLKKNINKNIYFLDYLHNINDYIYDFT